MTTSTLLRIPLAQLHESPLNPRKHYDEAALKQLAESLAASGQITPITVRPTRNGKGGYEIAAGHRRSRAAALAGLDELEAKVREDLRDDDAGFIEILNVENLQRDDLHPLEEAQGFRTLMEKAGYDIAKIATRIGKSVKYVYDRLKLLQLIPEAQKLFIEGAFEAGHAILLARIPPSEQKRAIAHGPSQFNDYSVGGLFQRDRSEGELALEAGPGKIKAVSVREFETWIKRHVRFDPTKEDLPNLFPDTAALLASAEPKKQERMVFITHDHRVSDDAKDPAGKRTYGAGSWKRADGAKGSKECERSVVGVVAAGKGRGDAFLVCVNRDRCEVHYGPEVKARLRREAARAKPGKGSNGSGAGRQAQDDRAERKEEEQRRLEEIARLRWEKALPSVGEALKRAIDKAPAGMDSPAAKLVVERCKPFNAGRGAAKYVPTGRGADAVVRLAAFYLLAEDALDPWRAAEAARDLKLFGVDAQKILDEVAPATSTLDEATAKCEKCGCTMERACKVEDGKGGWNPCSWDAKSWKAGKALCSSCVKPAVQATAKPGKKTKGKKLAGDVRRAKKAKAAQ